MKDQEKEKAQERFDDHKPVLVFAPQCSVCNNNVDGYNCAAYKKQIPQRYFGNEGICPQISVREGSVDPWAEK